MIALHISQSLWSANLDEILLKFYPLHTIQILHESFYQPAARTLGLKPAEGKLKKAKYCEDLMQLESNAELRATFFMQMPEKARLALSIVSGADFVNVDELESYLGISILEIQETSPKQFYGPLFKDTVEHADFTLLVFQDISHGYGRIKTKSDVVASLPPAMAALCELGLPKLKEATLQGHASYSPAGEDVQFFPVDHSAITPADFQQTQEFLQRNPTDLTVEGLLKVPTLKKLTKFYGDRKFYSGATDSPLLNVERARLLGNFLQIAGKSGLDVTVEKMSSTDGFQQSQRDLVKFLKKGIINLCPLLLPHLRIRFQPKSSPKFLNIWDHVLAVFTKIDPDAWILTEDLDRFLLLNRKRFSYRSYYELETVNVVSRNPRDYYGYRTRSLNPQDIMELLIRPLIKSTAFLLSALGFLQVAYTKPNGEENYVQKKHEWLTPSDGLLAWRLTPLGAFAFGLSQELTLQAGEFQSMKVRFYADQPLVRVENVTPVTNSFLDQYLERLVDGFYRFDRARFFKGCRSKDSVQSRLKEFMDRVPGEMPANWMSMLGEINRSTTALHEEDPWRVFRLEASSPLMELVSTDPVLSLHVYKISGGRVGLPEKDWPKVQKRLHELGFYH